MWYPEAAPAILSRSSEEHDTLVYPICEASRHAPCLADASWYSLDKVCPIPPGIQEMFVGSALLGSEDSTAMGGAKAGLAVTALRLDLEAPLPADPASMTSPPSG
jgi:hypothetical protein